MMDRERTAILLSKYLADELSPEEREELDLLILADPFLGDTLSVVDGLHTGVPGLQRSEEEDAMLEKGLSRLRSVIGDRYEGVQGAADTKKRPGTRDLVRMADEADDGRRGEARTGDGVTMREGVADGWKGEAQIGDLVRMGVDIANGDIDLDGEGNVRQLRKRSIYRWLVAASVVTIVIAGGLRYFRKTQAVTAMREYAYREVAAKYGTRSFLELPDGSRLWLNAGSKVSYKEGFADGRHELTLTGEAYFDIRHDPDHPFIVHTGKIDVKVLGTSFNVKAYPNDSTIETTLINGKVEIDVRNGTAGKLLLAPSEKVVIPTRGIALKDGTSVDPAAARAGGMVLSRQTVRPDSLYKTIIETSWVEDKLVFRNETFSEVAEKLERWYNIRMSFENERYRQVLLSGSFKDQSIGNVMDALQISLGFHYKITKDRILIF